MSVATSQDHLIEPTQLTPERLAFLVDRGACHLADRLARARTENDLTWRSLLSVQAEIATRDRVGSAPGSHDFWTDRAEPMARPLFTVCLEAIDEETELATAAIQRLDRFSNPQDAEMARRIGGAWSTITFDQSNLDSLGQRWQKRLRRKALPKALIASTLRPASQFNIQRDLVEMAMLDRPPWRHGDRLLAAFELAHADVRAALRESQADVLAALQP